MTQTPNTPYNPPPEQPPPTGEQGSPDGRQQQMQEQVQKHGQQRVQQAASAVRKWSDDLAGMAQQAPDDSPAGRVVSRAADGGQRCADYLEERGMGGVAHDVQGFARERPAAFLGGAALAGFALGRMAKAGLSQHGGRQGQQFPQAPEGQETSQAPPTSQAPQGQSWKEES